MLVPHIALRFECRIHSYGALSTTIRRQLGWVKRDQEPGASEEVVVAEEGESEFVKLRKRSWARLIAKVYIENPALCRCCGKEMSIICALTSPHHDEVIEKILKARGEYDPPWKKTRAARGPPTDGKSIVVTDEYSQVLPEGDASGPTRPNADHNDTRDGATSVRPGWPGSA